MPECASLISCWGYLGIILGTFFEGETTVLIAGIFAKLGYFKLRGVFLCASLGTFLGDSFFFFLGKHFGRPIIERYEFLRKRAALSNKIIHRYGNHILFIMRFLAGFRSIILLLLGCANFRSRRFLVLDFVSSVVWSAAIGLFGYVFANFVYIFINDIKGYEDIIIPTVILLSVTGILLYRHFIREKEEEQFDGD